MNPRAPHHGRILAVLFVVAAGLRLWNVRVGLPDFPEPATPFRIALGMMDVPTGRIDWNPHRFDVPSLAVYLHLAVQQLSFLVGRLIGATPSYADYILSYDMNPTPMVVAARLLGIASDLVAIAGIVRIGERLSKGAGLAAGGALAFAPLLVTASRSILSDSLMAALAVWAVERMVAYHVAGRRRDIVLATVLVGLAAGAHYAGGVLMVPAAWLLWRRSGRRALLAWSGLVVLAFVVFLATTPFAVLDVRTFWRDVVFPWGHAAGGDLGGVARAGFFHLLGNVLDNLGRSGIILLPVGLALSLAEARLRPPIVVLGVGALLFAARIPWTRLDAELVPVLLLAMPVAAAGGFLFLERISRPWLRRAWVAAMVLGCVPVAVAGVLAAARGYDTTQLQSRRWIEAHVARGELVVQEAGAARLVNDLRMQELRSEPAYAHASARWRARLDSTRSFHVVTLPGSVRGRLTTTVLAPGRPLAELEVLNDATALDGVFQDPRLYAAADWFVTTDGVLDRATVDRARHAASDFHRMLDRRAARVARFLPRRGVIGPEIRIYRIGDRYRDGLAPIDPRWWASVVPDEYHARYKAWLGPADGLPAVTPPPDPPAWFRSLAPVYERCVRSFVSHMGANLAALDRDEPAREFARATLEVDPVDLEATLLDAGCSGRLGQWEEARAATERALAAVQESKAEPSLVLLHARTLEHTGDPSGARRRLSRLLARTDLTTDVAFAAEQLYASLAPAPPPDSSAIAGDP